jgi:XTP/dITP diphosphohydrolase
MAIDIVLASGNKGKIAELQGALEPLGLNIIPQSSFNCTDAIENGLSFVENAILKARHACAQTGLPAIADDSGLEVDALKGQPGIYSARYAGAHGNDQANNQKLISELKNQANRNARFQCALAFMRHENDPNPIVSQAFWTGEIIDSLKGDNGFGYDPLFWIPELEKTSAQLDPIEKKRISHRAKALIELNTKLSQILHLL